MRRIIKIIFILLIPAACYLLPASPVYAQDEFITRFTSIYDIDNQGVTQVSHQIELTNRLANVYANEYALTVGSTRIKNVSASSDSNLPVTINVKDNTTVITVQFAEPTLGKDKTQRFIINYTNLDIATKTGRVLEVNIPKLADGDSIDDYSVVIKVPDIFDAPTIMSPITKSITQINGERILRYAKNQIGGKAVSILFGDHQIYDFTLRYNLKNTGLTPGYIDVAIPPDTAYQKTFYESINPRPLNVSLDPDGNWLARYYVKPQQNSEVIAVGKAILYLKPTLSLSLTTKIDNYLISQTYWPVKDTQLEALAKKLATPGNIYNYVVDNLTYNYNRIESSTTRLGAKNAFLNPKNAICTEFTDLFVTLARAAGIPARAQDGFAFTTNSKLRPLSLKLDILHAWPEYFDSESNAWRPVDPTWGNTTQGIDYFSRWDLNHFTFAIHGSDSVTPFPAGAYKFSNTIGKDVNVAFSLDQPEEKKAFQVDFSPSSLSLPLLPKQINLQITNLGNTAIDNYPFTVTATGYNIQGQPNFRLPYLPPYAKANFKLKLTRQLTATKGNLTVNLNNEEYRYEIPTALRINPTIKQAITAIALGSIFSLITYSAWRLFIYKRTKSHHLRR